MASKMASDEDSYDMKRIVFKEFTPCVKTGMEERKCMFEKKQKKHLKVTENASKYSKTKKLKELKNQNETIRMKELKFIVRYFNAHSNHDKVPKKVQKKMDSTVEASVYSLRSRAPTVVENTKPSRLEHHVNALAAQLQLDDDPACTSEEEDDEDDDDDDEVSMNGAAAAAQEETTNAQLAKLKNEHAQHISQLKKQMAITLEEAVRAERARSQEQMKHMEEQHVRFVKQLPLLNEVVKSYSLLQAEIQTNRMMIEETVTNVKKEVIAAIGRSTKELMGKYEKEKSLRKKYHNELVQLKGNIRVFCRVRPVVKTDGSGQQAEDVVVCDRDDDGLLHVNCKGRAQKFEVDRVFDTTSTQEKVYNEVKSLVNSFIDGYNVCIFAYGQTGSGKTFTMEGNQSDPGINQRALYQLFEETSEGGQDCEYGVSVSALEIYNETIRDLLSDDTSQKMEVKINPQGGVHIPGLTDCTVTSVDEVNEYFKISQRNRATAATNMNEHSSRSHALLCVTVTGVNRLTGVKTTGKLNLVDLAGSERVSKTNSEGTRLKEAQSINKSLSSLGDVIYALRSKQSFIPYRNSKLTYLLKESLGGDSKTLMITQISPVRKNEGETICSLNFAQRVRNVELGAATRKRGNGDVAEIPARIGTPQRWTTQRCGTPAHRVGTPSQQTASATKLRPSTLHKK